MLIYKKPRLNFSTNIPSRLKTPPQINGDLKLKKLPYFVQGRNNMDQGLKTIVHSSLYSSF